jgi:Ca2+-binding EF-hand superfamily protein
LQLPKNTLIDTRIVEELFAELDKDQNQRVSLTEFVEAYFTQQMQVEERI